LVLERGGIKPVNSSETRIRNLTVNNQLWLMTYLSSKKSGTANMRSDLINLFELHEGDIADIQLLELEAYLEMIKADNAVKTVNRKIGTIENFLEHIRDLHSVILSFEPKVLSRHRNNDKNIIAKGKSKFLKLSEISKIRTLFANDDLRLFTFEMVYRYGCKMEELAQCHQKTYVPEKQAFKLKKTSIVIDDDLHTLILKTPRILNSKTKETHSEYLRNMGEKALQEGILKHSQFTWQNITDTRKKNCTTCPECEKSYPSHSQYWRLVQYENDPLHKKWFLCTMCVSVKPSPHSNHFPTMRQ
jgi:hypothetical protein